MVSERKDVHSIQGCEFSRLQKTRFLLELKLRLRFFFLALTWDFQEFYNPQIFSTFLKKNYSNSVIL